MQLTTWHPFQEMDNLLGRNVRLFNTRLPALFDKEVSDFTEWSPSADISETKKELHEAVMQ